jgi:hypothetical protein
MKQYEGIIYRIMREKKEDLKLVRLCLKIIAALDSDEYLASQITSLDISARISSSFFAMWLTSFGLEKTFFPSH